MFLIFVFSVLLALVSGFCGMLATKNLLLGGSIFFGLMAVLFAVTLGFELILNKMKS